MAFENVFGQVDFRTPERKQIEQQRQFMQMLGMGMQQAQHAQRMDLQERQLAAKGSDFNLKRAAETALMKRNMGMPLNDQEMSAITTMVQIAPPVFSTDEHGRTISRPSGWGSVQGSPVVTPQQFADGKPPSADPMAASQAAIVQREQDIGANPYQSPGMSLPTGQLPADYVDDIGVIPADPMATLQDKAGRYTGSPKEMKRAGEGIVDIEVQTEKQKREQAFEMAKERRQKAAAKKEAKPQAILDLESSFQEAKNINSTIKDAYDSADIWTTGFLGEKTKAVAGTPAHDLAANMSTIMSDAGLSKLIEVKARGGTFGALQDRELQLLIDNRASLTQSQSPKQFKENLIKYQQQRTKTMRLMAEFYEAKFGAVPDGLLQGLGENIIDPRVERAKRGDIFQNPQTGEKQQYKDGKWQTVQ